MRMRIGRQAFAIDFLTKVIKLVFAQSTFKVRTRIDTRRRMALEKHQVGRLVLGFTTEKVIETDIIKGRTGSKRRDMTTQIQPQTIGPLYHGQRIPAHYAANTTFHEHVTRHFFFGGNRNGVAIRCDKRIRREGFTGFGGFADQALEQKLCSFQTLVLYHRGNGISPFPGFLDIKVFITG